MFKNITVTIFIDIEAFQVSFNDSFVELCGATRHLPEDQTTSLSFHRRSRRTQVQTYSMAGFCSYARLLFLLSLLSH